VSILFNIDVPDLDHGIAFYTQGVGFSLRCRLFNSAVAELEYAGLRVSSILAESGTRPLSDSGIQRDNHAARLCRPLDPGPS
jgi:hypothetical protein